MKIKALALGLSMLFATSAQAAMIAGWNFSQYQTGFLSVDGLTNGPDVLDSNFSDLDTDTTGTTGLIPGLGDGSQTFGNWYINGAFGSTDTVLDLTFVDPFRPAFGNLTNNNGAPDLAPSFNGSNTSLVNDGQTDGAFDNRMVFDEIVSSVFEGDLSSVSEVGSSWEIAFAGVLESGIASGEIGVEVSTNGGASFSSVGTATLGSAEDLFTFALGGTELNGILVRLNADAGTAIDNVSLSATLTSVPEPGTAILALTGLAGLSLLGRRRS